MKIAAVKSAVDLCIRAGITAFCWGRHGIGKSTTIRELCFWNDWGYVNERLSEIEAADLRGLAAKDEETRTTVYYPPAQFPRGDMSLEEIAQRLAETLGTIPPERRGIWSPIQQMVLTAKSGRNVIWDNDTPTFEGEELSRDSVRKFTVLYKQLQPRFPRGIFFLDEFNRAEDDVLNASFELVLDHSIGMAVLPPDWGVVAAGNYTEGYSVNPMMNELALTDRFCHLDMTFDLDDWGQWMVGEYGTTAQSIVEFGMQNREHVTGNIEVSNTVSIQPSPRSWAMVGDLLRANKDNKFDKVTVQNCISGLIGAGLAVKFSKYNCPVRAQDVLDFGMSNCRETLDKIVKDDKEARGVIGGLVFGVLSFADTRLKDTSDTKTIGNLLDFAEFLATSKDLKDLAVAFMRSILGSKLSGGPADEDIARHALLSNDRLSALVSKYKPGQGQLRVLDKLNERPTLRTLMRDVSWGKD